MLAKAFNAILLVAGTSIWFLLSTFLLDEVPVAALVIAIALAAFAIVVASGFPSFTKMAAASPTVLLEAAAAGILMLVAAPALVMSNRFTDAPPGGVTLFLTTAGWGVAAVLVGSLVRDKKPNLTQVAFVLAGVLGSASVLANWERPSSFSPFVRYPRLEIAFLAAGLLWALGGVLLARSTASAGARNARFAAGTAAVLAALMYAAVSGEFAALATAIPFLSSVLAAGVAFAAAFIAWMDLEDVDDSRRASLWLLPTLVLTVVGVAEQRIFPRGPDPVIWEGAAGGIVLIVMAVILIWLSAHPRPSERVDSEPTPTPLAKAALVLSVIATVAAAATLLLPALVATAEGFVDDVGPYRKVWNYLGYEVAGGWLALVAALLVLAGGLVLIRHQPLRTAVTAALGALITVGTYPLLAPTPLHTWNRWVPVQVQAEYGTEYANLGFMMVRSPLRLAALGIVIVAAIALLAATVLAWRERKRLSGS